MNATPVFAETPNVAAPNVSPGNSGLKSMKIKPISAEFKEQLKNCLENEQAAIAQVLFGSRGTNDNSMVINSEKPQEGIAGILEGFGLLDYQTDTLLFSANDAESALSESVQKQPDGAGMASHLSQEWMQVNEKPAGSGMSEQFARMLSNKQFNTLSPDLQQQVLSKVKEYLGSLESTNNDETAIMAAESITMLPDTDGEVDFQKLLLQAKMQKSSPDAEIPLPADNSDKKVLVFKHAEFEKPQTAEKTAVYQDYTAAAQNVEEAVLPQAQVKDGGALSTMQQSRHEIKDTASDTVNVQANADGTSTAVNGMQKAEAPSVTAQTKGTAELSSDQPEFVRDNVVRIVDKISTQIGGGRHEFDVELKPEFLGKLNIKLTMENGSIKMAIKAGDAGVKGMICEQMPALQNLLKDKGITVTSIDISYLSETPADGGNEAYRQNGRQGSADKGSVRQTSDWLTGTSLYDAAAAEADYYYLSGSSVEYLA